MSNKPLSERAKRLLIEATKDDLGKIIRIKSAEGVRLCTNNKVYFTTAGELPGKTKDIWQDALAELFVNHLITKVGGANDLFWVTKSGYDFCYWPRGSYESPTMLN